MGVFDSVMVHCPKCGDVQDFQSKGGECCLYNYDLENCPEDVLSDVNRHSPYSCGCGISFEVDISRRKAVAIINLFNSAAIEVEGNTVGYWKANAEEDYTKVPISVLKYIGILEKIINV